MGLDLLDFARPEGQVDQSIGRLGHQPLAPEGLAEPVTEESPARAGLMHADDADQLAGLVLQRQRQNHGAALGIADPTLENPAIRRRLGIGMGDARRHLRDVFVPGQAYNRGRVGNSWPTEPQTLGFEPKNVVA